VPERWQRVALAERLVGPLQSCLQRPHPLQSHMVGRILGASEPWSKAGGIGLHHAPRRSSDVQIDHLQRIVLDELAPRLDHVAHQGLEDGVSFAGVLDPHLKQAARLGIERGLP
jgi:hypothetical protein